MREGKYELLTDGDALPTSSEYVFKTNEKYNQDIKRIDNLIENIKAGNETEVINLLQQIVLEWKNQSA